MNPSDAAWWWQYGLDGIVGGLVAGAITAGAVVATLRHERKAADLQGTRLVAARVQDAAWRVGHDLAAPRDLHRVLSELSMMSRQRWPELAVQIDRIQAGGVSDSRTAQRSNELMLQWSSDPEDFSRNPYRVITRRRRRLRASVRYRVNRSGS